jgi:ethanolamine utilization protein EutQ (cupin superfamily)
MVPMLNVGEKTARFMIAKPGSFFVLPKNEDVPIRTCAKFGVKLFVTLMSDKPFKIVKRI